MNMLSEPPRGSHRNYWFYVNPATHSLCHSMYSYVSCARSLHICDGRWARILRSLVGSRPNSYANNFSEVWGLLLFNVFLHGLWLLRTFRQVCRTLLWGGFSEVSRDCAEVSGRLLRTLGPFLQNACRNTIEVLAEFSDICYEIF